MLTFKSADFTNGFPPFGISKGVCHKGDEYELHRHEFIELVYILSGISTHCIDGCTQGVEQGEILFIGYNQTHSFVANETIEYYNLFIKPEYISEHLANAETIYDIFSFFILDKYFDDEKTRIPVIKLSKSHKLEMDALISKMYEESIAKNPGYELALDGYMRLVFSRIIRALRPSGTHRICNTITPQLLEYIDANYTTNLTMSALANKCFYNPAYLGRMFKNTFNISLRDYICEKRVAYAMQLLADTDESIENISALVGYEDKKQFYRVFKEKALCTPKQYRDSKKQRL